MRTQQLLNVMRENIPNPSLEKKKVGDEIFVMTTTGNKVWVNKKPGYDPGIFDDFNPTPSYHVGVFELEKYEISEAQYNEIRDLFFTHDKI